MNLLREFDLTYWQMREALGLPIPHRIDRRFPRKLAGNGGTNPFKCGVCVARSKYPDAHRAGELRAARADAFEEAASFVLHNGGCSHIGSWSDLADAVRGLQEREPA